MIREMWKNGGRVLLLASMYLATALLVLISVMVVLVYGSLTKEGPYEPLYGYTEQTIENRVVKLGEPVVVTGTKCAHGEVSVTGEWHWRRVSGSVLFIPVGVGSHITTDGCVTKTFTNPPPVGITPGTWQIEGSETAARGKETQIMTYHSQTFEVVQ